MQQKEERKELEGMSGLKVSPQTLKADTIYALISPLAE